MMSFILQEELLKARFQDSSSEIKPLLSKAIIAMIVI